VADDTRRPEVPLAMEDDKVHRRVIAMRANASLPKDGSDPMQEPLPLMSYTVTGAPTASLWEGSIIYVSDDTPPGFAYSDGTNWRRCIDGAIIGADLVQPVITNSWSFDSPAGSFGTFYFGGFYQFHSASFTPAGGTNVGSTNSSYAAHVLVVLGAASTNMVVRVTGTSINDSGTRTTTDTEDIDTSSGSANDYYETAKKFIGQVSVSLQTGTGVIINSGFAKYWDDENTDFTVSAVEATWLGGANDSGIDIELIHHKATGWTYGAGGAPTLPTAIASLATDHSTEKAAVNGENGAWKRTNLSTAVAGSSSEGILWRVTTTANKAFELGNLLMTATTI